MSTPEELAQEAKRLVAFVLEHQEAKESFGLGSEWYLAHLGNVRNGTEELHASVDAMAQRIAELEAKCKRLDLECEAHAAVRRLECANLTKRAESAEALVEQQAEALRAAREQITADRQVLFDCHVSPITGCVNDLAGREGLAEYDAVLAKIDAALQQEKSND